MLQDGSAISRQWTLLGLLGARRLGVGVQDLASELGVSIKTIRRDLNLLTRVGFCVQESEPGPHGKKLWRLKTTENVPALLFNYEEAFALYLGRRWLDPLAGTILGEAAQTAFRKIRASLPPNALRYLDKLSSHVHMTTVGASDYSQKSQQIDDLTRAIEEGKTAIITYHPLRATEPVEYEINPYDLAWHNHALYFVAWSRDADAVRVFKMDRVQSVDVTEFPFHRPDDFDVRQYLADSFGVFRGDGNLLVRLRFSALAARHVTEGRWHASQKLEPQRDGTLIAEFRLSGTEEIKRWALSFGQQVEVLEPLALRNELRDELRTMAAAYDQPVPTHTPNRTRKKVKDPPRREK